jgi:hypothetical protein
VPKITQEQLNEKRGQYMSKKITHDEFYLWLSDSLGLSDTLIPTKDEELARSTDPYFNDIQLRRWDNMDSSVRYYCDGLYWSLCNTVCCLKAIARRRKARLAQTTLTAQ